MLALGLACSAAAATTLDSAILGESAFDSTTSLYIPQNENGENMTFSGKSFTLMLVIDMDTLNSLKNVPTSNTEFVATYAITTTPASSNYGYCGLGIMKDGDTYTISDTFASDNARQSLTLGTTSSTGKVVVTLAVGDHNTNNPSTLYVYDGTTLSSVNDNGYRVSNPAMQSLYFREGVFSSAIDSVYLFNTRVAGDDIATLSADAVAASVPEPTTATLSLLALAGLAARRRRK